MIDASVFKYKLGIDIGVASIAVALLGDSCIYHLFVRTFDKAEVGKDGSSLNKIRRDARSASRRVRRRRHRLEMLRRLFHSEGIVLSSDKSVFITSNSSPWALRSEGLDKLLNKNKWASVIYHIIKHRGFQSNKKSEVKKDKDTGKMLKGVNNNKRLLSASEYRTVGELIFKHPQFRNTKRNKVDNYSHTIGRAELLDEIKQLFKAQRQFDSSFASEAFEEKVIKLLLQRRATSSGDDIIKMVGNCTLEKGEKRAPSATYSAERFVWLGILNNLRIDIGNGEVIPLSVEQRALLIEQPFLRAELKYSQVRKILGMSDNHYFSKLNYSKGKAEESKLFVAKAYHALRKEYRAAGLKEQWRVDCNNTLKLDTLFYALTVFKSDAECRDWLVSNDIDSQIIEAALNISFTKFKHLSLVAIRKLIPFMEKGYRYDQAVQMAGYEHHGSLRSAKKQKYLPPLDLEDITNPVVRRSLLQARKLINAVIRKYGSPMAVNIELARDLLKSYEDRSEINNENIKRKDNNIKESTEFEDKFGFKPNGINMMRLRLYREQNGQCPYTQKPLVHNGDISELFSDCFAEVDHALPFSRSFDNGFKNMVLTTVTTNRNKGSMTPYEFLNGSNDTTEWQRFCAFVSSNPNYSKIKKRTLMSMGFYGSAEKEFRQRNLNDTRYISKLLKNLIEENLQLHPDSKQKRCTVVSGRLTACLRSRWGLVKSRSDGDLHHALDAAVIAACTPTMIQKVAEYHKNKELGLVSSSLSSKEGKRDEFPMPFPTFRAELLARLSKTPMTCIEKNPHLSYLKRYDIKPIRVSRPSIRRRLGAAHEATIRSAKYYDEGKTTISVPLEKLKLKDLNNMVGLNDPRNKLLINKLRERLVKFDGNSKLAFEEPLYKTTKEEIGDKYIVKRVKLFQTLKSGRLIRNGIAKNDKMIRVDIFTDQQYFYTVPIYVADTVSDRLPNKAITRNKSEEEWLEMGKQHEFLFSLYPDDWVKITLKDGVIDGYYSGVDRSNGSMSIYVHDRDRSVGEGGLKRSIGIKTALKIEKYHISTLGDLYLTDKEERKGLCEGDGHDLA